MKCGVRMGFVYGGLLNLLLLATLLSLVLLLGGSYGGQASSSSSSSSLSSSTMFKMKIKHRDGNVREAIARSAVRQQRLQRLALSWPQLRKRGGKNHHHHNDNDNNITKNGNYYKTILSSGDGGFLTTVTMGSPGVDFEAIVDTGSDLVWRQCKPCQRCFSQNNPIFDPSQSSTYSTLPCSASLCKALPRSSCNLQCQYYYSYGGGSSTEGDLSYDTLSIANGQSGETDLIPNFAFGCSKKSSGDFTGMEGILGLGQGLASLPTQLSATAFSYCLIPYSYDRSQSSPLFVGDVASISGAFFNGNAKVQTMPILSNPSMIGASLYYIPLQGISVGGTRLEDIPDGVFKINPNDGSGGIIIDSGTTLTYFVEPAFRPLHQALLSTIDLPLAEENPNGFDLCYSQSGSVPTITLHFEGGVDFHIPPENSFIQYNELFCLSMASSGGLIGGISILGNMQQINNHFLYDHSGQKLSFISTPCNQL